MAPGSPPPGPAKMPTERNRSLASNPKTKQNETQGAGSEGRKKKKKKKRGRSVMLTSQRLRLWQDCAAKETRKVGLMGWGVQGAELVGGRC